MCGGANVGHGGWGSSRSVGKAPKQATGVRPRVLTGGIIEKRGLVHVQYIYSLAGAMHPASLRYRGARSHPAPPPPPFTHEALTRIHEGT